MTPDSLEWGLRKQTPKHLTNKNKATAKSNLNTYIKWIHEEVKYPCSECDYEVTQNRD